MYTVIVIEELKSFEGGGMFCRNDFIYNVLLSGYEQQTRNSHFM